MTNQNKAALADAPLSSGLVTMVTVQDEKKRVENDYVMSSSIEKRPPSALSKDSEATHYEELPDFASGQDYATIHKDKHVAKVHVTREPMNSGRQNNLRVPDLPERRQSGENRSVVYVSA